jgi:hypothetical protein
MKWMIRIELTADCNKPITCDIGTITRPIADLLPRVGAHNSLTTAILDTMQS